MQPCIDMLWENLLQGKQGGGHGIPLCGCWEICMGCSCGPSHHWQWRVGWKMGVNNSRCSWLAYPNCKCFRNLIDAANIAALAALLTFRRPECTIGGEDGQEITIHPPEVLFALEDVVLRLLSFFFTSPTSTWPLCSFFIATGQRASWSDHPSSSCGSDVWNIRWR